MKKHFLSGSEFYVNRPKIHTLFLTLFFCGFLVTHAQISTLKKEMRKAYSEPVVCPALFKDMHTHHGIPEMSPLFLQSAMQKTATAEFDITFGPGALADPQVQEAFQFALDIWATEIVSSVPIRVFVDFATLGNGVLASANATHFLENFPGAPESDVFYPAALANSIAGEILDPNEEFDLFVNLGDSIPFYFGMDGNTQQVCMIL